MSWPKWIAVISKSLRLQLILGVAVVHLVLMTILVLNILGHERSFMMERARQQILSQAQVLATSSISYVLMDDLAGLQEIVFELKKDHNVRYALVQDPAGQVLGHTDDRKIRMFLVDSLSVRTLNGAVQSRILHEEEESIEAISPILVKGRLIGWARVARSLAEDRAYLRSVTRDGQLFTLVAIVLGTLFAILLSRLVLHQLQMLLRGAKRIADNRLDEPIPLITKNEVGVVTTAFNDAMQKLREQRSALEVSEKRFRDLYDGTPSMILTVTPEGAIQSVNAFGAEQLRYNATELVGAPITVLFDAASADEAIRNIELAAKETGLPVQWEGHRIRRDGSTFWSDETTRAIRDQEGNTVILMACEDITAKKQTELIRNAIYRISEAALHADSLDKLYATIHANIAEFMPAKNFYIGMYDEQHDILSFPYHVDERDTDWEPIKAEKTLTGYVVQTGAPLLASTDVFLDLIKSGKVELRGEPSIDWLGVPLKDQSGRIFGVMVVQSYDETIRLSPSDRDVMMFISTQVAMAIERKEAAGAVKSSEERYRHLFHQSPIGIMEYDSRLRLTALNGHMADLLRSTSARLQGVELASLMDKAILAQIQVVVTGREGHYEGPFSIRDTAEDLWIELKTSPLYDDHGRVRGGIGIVEDITERKKASDRMLAALREKEILLKEIHHRVKNNLQLMSSLLRLQAASIPEEQARGYFQESLQRIQSMALVHNKLYRNQDLANIDFGDYLKDLVKNLMQGLKSSHIECLVDAGEVSLGVDSAVPCGLIVNELLTNALTHAFPDGTPGNILVTLRRTDDGLIDLRVKDNGIGIPGDLDIHVTNSMGMNIVTNLTDQLSGTITLEGGAGSTFILRFPG